MRQTQGLKRTTNGVRARRTPGTWRQGALGLGLGLALGAVAPSAAWAQADAAPPPSVRAATSPAAPASVPTIAQPDKPPVDNSYLDGPLLYQLLLSEFALRENEPGDAVELMLEAARHNHDDALFRRALQIAVEAGAGDKALAIVKSWRQTMPRSTEAVRTQVQLLLALDHVAEAADPLQQLLSMSAPAERDAAIGSLPRAAQRAKDKPAAAREFDGLVQPWVDDPASRTAALVALGRLKLVEGQPAAALDLAAQAQAADPKALPPVLLALDLMNASTEATQSASSASASASASAPAPASANANAPGPTADAAAKATAENGVKAEAIVRRYLGEPDAEPLVRQAFAGVLAAQQRLTDAADQLRLAAQARPRNAQLWMGLGEVELELHHPQDAETALQQALALVKAAQADQPAADPAADPAPAADDDTPANAPADPGDAGTPASPEAGQAASPVRLAHVQLLLARAAEERHDDAAATQWLSQVDAKDADLQVLSLRASILARQGKLDAALALVDGAPANTPAEQRYKLLTQVQLLLDEKKLKDARNLLTRANQESPDDVDLIYQEAMVDEQLKQLDDMEILLRRILVLQPDNSQALNALGYSLADRNVRLDEAFGLVKQAHDLSPADPFIVDSLGWVEFRLGHFDTAATLLSQAYTSRKDTEIAAHLGEVLWADGHHAEAMQVLRDAHRLDAGNEVLKQTMARLKVTP